MTNAWGRWFAAAARGDVDAALRGFYAELDAEVAAGPARCDQSGRCCHFDAFGHRLYVTALEVAWFVRMAGGEMADGRWQMEDGSERRAALRLPVLSSPVSHQPSPPSCPYQIDGLCSQHAIRPLGCRVFFCQAGTEEWQHELYERYLARLKAIHSRFDVSYCYLEWRAGLAEALADAGVSANHNAQQLPLRGNPRSGDRGR